MKNWEKIKVSLKGGVDMKHLDLKSNMYSLTEPRIRYKLFFPAFAVSKCLLTQF